MSQHDRGLEAKVGAFVFVGLAMLAALVVQFGRVGEGLKTYYALTVQFPDASGLLKGSDVLLAGAKIGLVSGGPRIAPGGQGVSVPLRIYDYVKIPTGSKFTVGSSGLLGDRFVAVWMPPGKPTSYLSKNASVAGARETGLDDITREGDLLIKDLRGTVQNINTTVTRLNDQALSSGNMENLKATIEHLNQTTGSLAESSKKIDGVLDKADNTMTSAKKAADDLQGPIAEAKKLFREATSGNGLLATLLKNEQLGKDLQALISNLRSHGVLFYRDSAAKAEAARPIEERNQSPAPRRRARPQ
jgi:phospholipid/cholesterol/gamma-HCH transport system substrate-binding protein